MNAAVHETLDLDLMMVKARNVMNHQSDFNLSSESMQNFIDILPRAFEIYFASK